MNTACRLVVSAHLHVHPSFRDFDYSLCRGFLNPYKAKRNLENQAVTRSTYDDIGTNEYMSFPQAKFEPFVEPKFLRVL